MLDGGESETDREQVSACGDAIDESEGETLEDLVDCDHGRGAIFDGWEVYAEVVGDAETLAMFEATLFTVGEGLVEFAERFATGGEGTAAFSVVTNVRADASGGHGTSICNL